MARSSSRRPSRRPSGPASSEPRDPRVAAVAAEREARQAARDADRRAQRRAQLQARVARLRRRVIPTLLLLVVIAGGVFAGLRATRGGDPALATTASTPAGASVEAGDESLTDGASGPAVLTGLLDLQLDGTVDSFVMDFQKPPRAGIAFDLDTGQVFWRKDETRVLPMASVTKMMTALIVVNEVGTSEKIKVTREALAYQGSGVGVLPKNKWIGVSAMLHGLLLPSGNDAAIALAQKVSKTVPKFVKLMNQRAKQMGLACTRFASPSGIVDKGNHTCAADLAVLSRAVLDQPRLAKIVKRREAVLPFPIKGGKLYLSNHNYLLQERYPGTIGIKTGYTDAAGKCFVAAVKRGGHRYGVVLLHSPDPPTQTKQLLAAAYKAPKL